MESKRPFDAITFGEIMLRLSPTINERIVDGVVFEKRAGGSELNVSSGLSLLGLRTGIISKLPRSEIGTFIKNRIRFGGVSDDFLLYDESRDARLGVYYYENGAHPRKPCVVYDRKHSSINSITLEEIPESAYTSTRVFHTSGISLALSRQTREVALELVRRFRAGGAKISFDVNYRANLWEENEARRTIESILPYINILFVSSETSRRMFRKTGELHDIMKSYCQDYGVEVVATTNRQIISPKQHTFGSILYSAKEDRFYEEEPYANIEVVDRIGSGDAYVAGVLFGLLKYGDHQKALEFGNASSAVKNTVPGDMPASDFRDIERLIEEHQNKGLQSEMNR
ncbi:sugar kinase [Faecalispora jeddahensis]|uniref:sugar kinase n=1 Tax=Faecalispora jeddahensis TaxID=1414721 RepID=UPI0027B8DF5B|nr:sugar kinase [Faecalispora jeddahensis]